MRRQKIDLNFLVDFSPLTFVIWAEDIVNECITQTDSDSADSNLLDKNSNKKKAYTKDSAIDMLALLISGLQPFDVTQTKYPCPLYESDGRMPGTSDNFALEGSTVNVTTAITPTTPVPAPWTAETKISTICR